MRDRGKREVESYNNINNNNFGDYNFVGDNYLPEFPCKKHPNSASSSGGICAYCLTDRLAQLVCPQCGEQRLSSYCPCSFNTHNKFYNNPETSSSTNTAATDVGRISFLLENDKNVDEVSSSRSRIERRSSISQQDDYSQFRRSNSISTTAMNNNYNNNNNSNHGSRSETGKFWKKLFRKKRDKINQSSINNNNQNNEENNNYECNGVSRSRSLSSFRGFYDTDQENGGFAVSSSAARASSVSTGNFVLDSAKISCFSESEARMSNFDYCDASNFVGTNKNSNNIFSLKETEFVNSDDHAFIDLKLHDMSSESSRMPPDLAAMRRSGLGFSTKEFGFRGGGGGGGGGGDGLGHEMFRNGGGSCRVSSVSERELRKCRKSYKVWRWFFRHQTDNPGKFNDHAPFNS